MRLQSSPLSRAVERTQLPDERLPPSANAVCKCPVSRVRWLLLLLLLNDARRFGESHHRRRRFWWPQKVWAPQKLYPAEIESQRLVNRHEPQAASHSARRECLDLIDLVEHSSLAVDGLSTLSRRSLPGPGRQVLLETHLQSVSTTDRVRCRVRAAASRPISSQRPRAQLKTSVAQAT